jgi:hypothetical protein
MKARVLSCIVLIPVISAALVWGVRTSWDRWIAPQPILEYEASVDLGERERNEVAVGRFLVFNRGWGELRLDQFATSCGCAGVEREVDGEFRKLETVVVEPRHHVELIVRMAVTQAVGLSQSVNVTFASSDSKTPRGYVEVSVPRVRGGVYSSPNTVLFGELRVGSAATRVIDLFDSRQQGRRIEKVICSQPDVLHARFVPLGPDESAIVHPKGGRLMGRLEVKAQTARPASLSARIELLLAGESRQPDVVFVAGDVKYDVECVPSTVILPRFVGGKPVFSGEVQLRQRDGHPLNVSVDGESPGLAVRIRPRPGAADRWLLTVERVSPDTGSRQAAIRLRTRSNDLEELVEIPVLFTSGLPSKSQ